jgi:VWFA-related protein
MGLARSSPWDSDTVQVAIAEMTGGRAFYSSNDLKDMLEEATEAGSEYYNLTYSPSNLILDERLRNIRVQADKGYRLEYRHGYLATALQ